MYYSFDPSEILVYLRKSRADDPRESVEEVLARHEEILSGWADANLSGPIPEENIYREVVSGEHISSRPEIQKILQQMESPLVRAVLVVEVQRLSRGDLEDAGRLIKLFRYTNTKVITPQKIYDISDEYDRDFFKRELERGNEYLEYTKRILARGRYTSASEGWYIGSVTPYGWDRVFVLDGKRKRPTLAFNQETDTVRLMYELVTTQHMRPSSIAHHLDSLGIKPRNGKHWNSASIRDILKNPVNNGKIVWNRRKTVLSVEDQEVVSTRPVSLDYDIFPGRHEKLIPDDVFAQAQAILKENTHEGYSKELRNPLAGLLYCSCGRAMTYKLGKRPEEPPRYICEDHTFCHVGSALAPDVYDLIKDSIREEIRTFEVASENAKNSNLTELGRKQVARLRSKLDTLKKKEVSQWEKYSEEAMPKDVFEKLNRKVLEEQRAVETALSAALASIPDIIDYDEKIFRLKEVLSSFDDDTITAQEKNVLLRGCVSRIEYHRDTPVRLSRSNCCGEKLKTGGNWTSPPISIHVIFKV